MSKINDFRILHIESDAGERERCHCALLHRGYSGYQHARTGAEGLLLHRKSAFDVVLLEYRLSSDEAATPANGLDIARTLLNADPNLPVIMITGAGSEKIAAEALSIGVTKYLIKDGPGVYKRELPEALSTIAGRMAPNNYSADWATTKHVEKILRRKIMETENAGESIFTISKDGWLLDCNQTAYARLGYSKDEMLRLHVADLNPDFPKHEWPKMWRDIKNRKQFTFESLHCNKSGEPIPVEISVAYLEFEGEEYFCSFARDISKRNRAEQAIARGQAQLSAILETANDGIITIDDHGLISTTNPAAEDIFGYGSGELPGQNISILMGDTDRAGHNGHLAAYLATGKAHIIGVGREVQGRRKDGSHVPLRLSISEFEIDGQKFYTGFILDLTRQKSAEIAISDLSNKYRALFESARDGIYLIDPETLATVEVNEAGARRLGYSRDEMIGMSLERYVPTTNPHERRNRIRQILEENKNSFSDSTHIGKDGTAFPVESSSNVVDLDGRKFILTVSRDTTDRKKFEADLLLEKERSDVANRAKSEFLANMSHELRTPLNAIIGYSEALESELFGPIANERQKEYLATIYSSGRHLLKLINDILDLSAVEAGKIELQEEEIQVASVADFALRIMKSRAVQSGIRISNKMPQHDLRLYADDRRVKQILVNVLSNAVKFTPMGGKVTFSAMRETGGGVVFSIADTGVGMDAGELAKAMEMFGQVSNELTATEQGTGLGLPLTKHLLELHGGDWEIDSTPGQGTTVNMRFPKERVML